MQLAGLFMCAIEFEFKVFKVVYQTREFSKCSLQNALHRVQYVR